MLQLRKDAHDDEVREMPPAVVGAVAAGTASLPFLAIYAITFIMHGGIHKVAPPDITSTSRGELIAGFIALGLFLVGSLALLWMLMGRRRWPFVLVQLGMLGTAIDFFLDVTKGGRLVSFVVGLASLIAVGCALAPQSGQYVGSRLRVPRRARPAAESDLEEPAERAYSAHS